MDTRTAETVIIVPTLSVIDAAPVVRDARNSAGMDCAVLLASDHEPRGAVVVGNVLLRAALDWGARYICYLNDDAGPFTEGWLSWLVNAVEQDASYGIAVPGCPCRGGQQAHVQPGQPYQLTLMKSPSAWVCAVLKADCIRDVGWLDEKLMHYGDDTDFEWRMWEKGWKTVLAEHVWIGHDHTNARQEATPWYQDDIAYLKQKHGR